MSEYMILQCSTLWVHYSIMHDALVLRLSGCVGAGVLKETSGRDGSLASLVGEVWERMRKEQSLTHIDVQFVEIKPFDNIGKFEDIYEGICISFLISGCSYYMLYNTLSAGFCQTLRNWESKPKL